MTTHPEAAMTREQVLEEAARLVEQMQETHTSTNEGDRRHLTPRKAGNLAGLAYADGIRALASIREAARSTIAELQKRIGEMEAELKTNKLALEMCSNECNRLSESYFKQADALTAERQRREECEAALVLIATCSDYYGTEPNPIPVYEAKYGPLPPSESDNRTKVAGC